jgi:hypothetical protein
VGSAFLSGTLDATAPAQAEQAAIKALDTDNDGTLDLGRLATQCKGVRRGRPGQGRHPHERRVRRIRNEAIQTS